METNKEKAMDQAASCRCCNEIPDTRNIAETKDQLKFHNPQIGQTTDELNEVESSEYATNDQFRTRPEYFNPKTCSTTTEKDEL